MEARNAGELPSSNGGAFEHETAAGGRARLGLLKFNCARAFQLGTPSDVTPEGFVMRPKRFPAIGDGSARR